MQSDLHIMLAAVCDNFWICRPLGLLNFPHCCYYLWVLLYWCGIEGDFSVDRIRVYLQVNIMVNIYHPYLDGKFLLWNPFELPKGLGFRVYFSLHPFIIPCLYNKKGCWLLTFVLGCSFPNPALLTTSHLVTLLT